MELAYWSDGINCMLYCTSNQSIFNHYVGSTFDTCQLAIFDFDALCI